MLDLSLGILKVLLKFVPLPSVQIPDIVTLTQVIARQANDHRIFFPSG